MIFALSRSIENYDLEYNGKKYGLLSSYGHDQHLFCLMSRMNSAFFMYEDAFDDFPTAHKISEFDKVLVDAYIATLDTDLGEIGIPVRRWLETTGPREWFEMIDKFQDLSFLPVAKLFEISGHNPTDSIKACTYVRTLQYMKFYRGKIEESGKVVRAAFGSSLTREEEEHLAKTKTEFKAAMAARFGGAHEK